METSSGGARTKPYHHGDLRRALIDAALDLISGEGVRALSLREVARRAGVSHAAPYRHFADKEALLAAVAEEGFRALQAAMLDRMQRAGGDPLQRLQASGIGYVLFAVQHAAHFRVMFGTARSEQPPSATLAEAGSAAFAVLTEALEAGQQAGVVRPDPVRDLALTAWSLVHGLAMLLVSGQLQDRSPSDAEVERLARMVTENLVRGLAVREARE